MATNADEVVIEQILKALKADQQSDNRYRGLCPAHDDHNPSLDIYINSDGYIGFNCLSKRCKSIEIVKAIKDKYNIIVPAKRTNPDSDKILSSKILYPAHEQKFPFPLRRDQDTIYEYTIASGEIAFFVQRYEDGGKKQTPAWFSTEYISKGGDSVKQWACKDPPKKDRPIYNLHLLNQYKDKPVLIVEGEKTAEAAQRLPQLKGFVVTTWSGGSKNVKASDWSVLKDRDTLLYFWPDHDIEGVKAMRDVAMYVSTGPYDNRLNILDWSELIETNVEKGWDLADGCGNITCNYTYEQLWEAFKPYYTDSNVSSGSIEEGLLKRDKYLRKLYLSGTTYIVDLRQDMPDEPFGVLWYRDLSTLLSLDVEKATIEIGEKIKHVSIAKEWYDTRGSGVFMLNGARFDPTTMDVEIKKNDGTKYLNTFKGFPVFESKAPNQRLTEAWLKHLELMIKNPDARTWIIDYYADIFQNPARKPGTALVFLGGQGVGKSVITICIATLLGTSLAKIINKDIGKNNIALSKSLLVVHDEWSINHYREKAYYEALKNAITNTRLKIEEKYIAAWESNSFCRFAFTSNDSKPIRLPPDDRRFTIIHCNRYWYENTEHFNELFTLIENKDALAGFLQFLKDRKITSNLTRAFSTIEKEELWEPDNKLLAELISWANGNGLPTYIQDKLGSIANKFGDIEINIPRKIMREYITKEYGINSYGNLEIAILQRIMPGHKYKKTIPIFDNKGETTQFGLCFTIPKLPILRYNIERELTKPYPWNDDEIIGNDADSNEPEDSPI